MTRRNYPVENKTNAENNTGDTKTDQFKDTTVNNSTKSPTDKSI